MASKQMQGLSGWMMLTCLGAVTGWVAAAGQAVGDASQAEAAAPSGAQDPAGQAEPGGGHDHSGHGGHSPRGTGGMKSPLDGVHLYLCAFHVAKNNPGFQVEAHHYCGAQSERVHQCVIYDSTGPGAKLLGVEYIIPDELYDGLPEAEKKYWHPHTYEILAGQLMAPNLTREEEDKVMKGVLTTWGKTWHTWRDPATEVPMGDPLLMWSFTGDGQANSDMIALRDRRCNRSTDALRKHRLAYGFPLPNIPLPPSEDTLGRQWTPSGPDEPATAGSAQPDTKSVSP